MKIPGSGVRPHLLSSWLLAVVATTSGWTPLAGQNQEPRPSTPGVPAGEGRTTQEAQLDPIARLAADLDRPGPDGRESRTSAVERLLSTPDLAAHQLLQRRLLRADQLELRGEILTALSRRLSNLADPVLGAAAADESLREELLLCYVETLAPYWQGETGDDGLLPDDALRTVARRCLLRMPKRELAAGLRRVAGDAEREMGLRKAALRAAGDGQDLYLGSLLADFLAAPEVELRAAAQRGLRLLTFRSQDFTSREDFDAWYAALGDRGYFELLEVAARSVGSSLRQKQQELARVQRQAAADYVRAVTEARDRVDWVQVQARAMVDDGALRACLTELQMTLSSGLRAGDAVSRQNFARALLARYREADQDTVLRGMMLEVAAYLVRASEGELAAEIANELMEQLVAKDPELQLAALRGLRRYPSAEARAAVVTVAQGAALQPLVRGKVLVQALQTLATSAEPEWRAPTSTAADKEAWLQLLREVAFGGSTKELRSLVMAVALRPDRDGKRVPEVFTMLLELARDAGMDVAFRTQALIKLMEWRDDEERLRTLVQELTELLADRERDVRQYAATTLARLPDAPKELKSQWITSLLRTLRERLGSEEDPGVLNVMVECLIACKNDPGTPGQVIGVLLAVLDQVGMPVPAEQEGRVNRLLQALMEVAADQRAGKNQQWLAAGSMLLSHKRRALLRYVLESQNVVALASDVASEDQTTADRARQGVRLLLLTALLKPQERSWTENDELRREATDVRAAFDVLGANERLPENVDDPDLRLLRLSVLVALQRSGDAIALAQRWLTETPPQDHTMLGPEQQDRVRLYCAQALLQEGKPIEAEQQIAAIEPDRAVAPGAIRTVESVGRALLGVDVQKALSWLQRVLEATTETDPAFRSRLVLSWQARVQATPNDLPNVLVEIDRRGALFDAPDCPQELKDAIQQLRGAKAGG
jgi:hypothetical protein